MAVPLTLSSVPAQTPYVQYIATAGQTVFPYPFEVTQDSDLVVLLNGVAQATDSGYTLSGQGTTVGGNVTFTLGQTAGTIVTLYRNISIARITQLSQSGTFFSSNFNNEFNRIYLIMQQLQQSLLPGGNQAYALMIPNSNNPTPTTLLTPASYAGKYLSFDSNGNPIPALLTTSGSLTGAIIAGLVNAGGTPILSSLVSTAQTAAELAAGVTPTNSFYQPGDVRRYGGIDDDSTDNATAINQAILVGGTVIFPPANKGIYRSSGSHVLTDGVCFVGFGRRAGGAPFTGTQLKYTGTGTFLTMASRNLIRDMLITTTGVAAPAGGTTVGVSWGTGAVGAGFCELVRCSINYFHIGLQNGGGLWCTAQDNSIVNNDYGIAYNMSGSTTSNACSYINNEIAFNGRGGVIGLAVPVRMVGHTFIGGSIEGNCQENTTTYPDQVRMVACAQLSFIGVYFEFASTGIIKPNLLNMNSCSDWCVQQSYLNQFGYGVYASATDVGKIENNRFLTSGVAWSGATSYGLGQQATINGVTYQSILSPNIANSPPNATYWSPVYDWNLSGGANVNNILIGFNETGSQSDILAGVNCWYQSGESTFTGTLTGCTTAPTGTFNYTIANGMATIELPADLVATSSSTACTITGLPAALTPANTVSVTGVTSNNTVDSVSRITIAGTTMTLYNGASATFTNAGTKGLRASTFSYKLT